MPCPLSLDAMYGSGGARCCPGLAAGALPTDCCSRTISAVSEFPFRERLRREFEARRNRNSRYSLRAFAAFLGADHSTLSQILRKTRPVPAGQLRSWSRKLGLDTEEMALYLAVERMPDAATSYRQERLLHWTTDATAVLTERVHWQILELLRDPDFRADCRWIAKRAGVSVDRVNLAWATLLRLRLIKTTSTGRWRHQTGLAQLTERAFRRVALARIRESAGCASGTAG
jgi:transcriptional regulator with XRE-family HTH domain